MSAMTPRRFAEKDKAIANMWRAGKNTAEIAKALGMEEWDIQSLIRKLREEGRL